MTPTVPPTVPTVPPAAPRCRLHVDDDLAEGAAVALEAGQAHHLRNVLRLGAGAPVALFNGRDGEWLARLDALDRKADRNRAAATPVVQTRPQTPSPDLWLCFAPVKKTAVDVIAEKATELGAAALQPVFTQHTAATRVNIERMRAHAIGAAEQCGRLDVPEVRPPVTLAQLTAAWPAGRVLIVCAEAGPTEPIIDVAARLAGRPAALLIGPEGGFAKSELDALSKLPSVHAAGLGPRLLRADTAVVAALALWQGAAGDGSERPVRRDL